MRICAKVTGAGGRRASARAASDPEAGRDGEAARAAGGGQRVGEQAGDRHRADAARDRGERAGDGGDAGEVDVAGDQRACRPARARG